MIMMNKSLANIKLNGTKSYDHVRFKVCVRSPFIIINQIGAICVLTFGHCGRLRLFSKLANLVVDGRRYTLAHTHITIINNWYVNTNNKRFNKWYQKKKKINEWKKIYGPRNSILISEVLFSFDFWINVPFTVLIR